MNILAELSIRENEEVEFKSANWELPKSIWESVSAFANTNGGSVVLGIEEKGTDINICGVQSPPDLISKFWSIHNNAQKLSFPICKGADVQSATIREKQIVVIKVPRANRQQRPVYIDNNPLTGTYKRNFDGDYRCTPDEVRQMLRDAAGEPQDSKILDGFSLADLDSETTKSFRQRFSSRDPDHPWLSLELKELLTCLGGWRKERVSGQEGLTLAGLLMFGRERSILDALPHYQLDYIERNFSNPEQRWTYRLTIDGKWEPNLFNFYYRVYVRLVNDLEVPFQLDKDAVRRGETHVHEALREAFVNTLIHADHLSTRPLLVFKQSEGYIFSNPGRLRISVDRLYEGGVSDARNPNLQKMFQMIGLGEKAGSGFQKILRAWREQQWSIPLVSEKIDLEITSVFLPLVSFIPQHVEDVIKKIVRDQYPNLTELDRIIMCLAHFLGVVSNIDIQRYRQEHPREIGDSLKKLVNNQWLEQSGRGRGTQYTLPSSVSISSEAQEDFFSQSVFSDSEHSASNSEHYKSDSEHSDSNSEHYNYLIQIAAPVRNKKRVSKEVVKDTILKLCADDFLQLRALADILGRQPSSIRVHYLAPMLEEGLLQLKYSDINHPQQAYKTSANHLLPDLPKQPL